MVGRDKARRVARDKEDFEAKPRDSMQEWVERCLAALPNLEVRRMFGGAGIYADGTMFGILHKGRVYLKTDERTRAAFVERGAGPFRATKNLVLKSYYELPADLLDDDAEFLSWSRMALQIAHVAPTKAKGLAKVSPSQILAGHSRPIRDLAGRLRKLVGEAAPDATEAGYAGWRLIGYRSPHYFCFIAPQADHVRLGFEHGVRLADPDGILEPMGKQVRFVRIIPGRALPTAAIGRLIQEALRTLPAGRNASRRQKAQR
jgi:DNA transformation protein